MDEILEQLNQLIEARVEGIKDEQERKKPLAYQKEMKEQAEHMNRILLMLPEDEREWLDARLACRCRNGSNVIKPDYRMPLNFFGF